MYKFKIISSFLISLFILNNLNSIRISTSPATIFTDPANDVLVVNGDQLVAENSANYPMVDIISVGSVSNYDVKNFFTITNINFNANIVKNASTQLKIYIIKGNITYSLGDNPDNFSTRAKFFVVITDTAKGYNLDYNNLKISNTILSINTSSALIEADDCIISELKTKSSNVIALDFIPDSIYNKSTTVLSSQIIGIIIVIIVVVIIAIVVLIFLRRRKSTKLLKMQPTIIPMKKKRKK